MRGIVWVLASVVVLCSAPALADRKQRSKASAKAPIFDVRGLMDANTRARTGLDKLTDEEVAALNTWFTELVVEILKRTERPSGSALSGTVAVAANDETFVIDTQGGRKAFKARTYCFGVSDGDKVIFTKSTSVCTSNTFVVRRTGKKCDVWCE